MKVQLNIEVPEGKYCRKENHKAWTLCFHWKFLREGRAPYCEVLDIDLHIDRKGTIEKPHECLALKKV